MTNHERTERSTQAGLHPEVEKAGSHLRDQPPAILACELRNPPAPIETALHAMRHRRVDEVSAGVFSVGVTVGPWLRTTGGRGWHALLAAAVVALLALLGIVWLYRARSTRRWKAALDAYAEREIRPRPAQERSANGRLIPWQERANPRS